jgi:hypothetical protein
VSALVIFWRSAAAVARLAAAVAFQAALAAAVAHRAALAAVVARQAALHILGTTGQACGLQNRQFFQFLEGLILRTYLLRETSANEHWVSP